MRSEQEIRGRLEEQRHELVTSPMSVTGREAKAYNNGFIDAIMWVLEE